MRETLVASSGGRYPVTIGAGLALSLKGRLQELFPGLSRLSGGSERRPRLRQGVSLEEEVRQVIRERDPLYREVADRVLSVGGASIATTLEEILSVLRPLSPTIGRIP